MSKLLQFWLLLLLLITSLQAQQQKAVVLSDSERNKLANTILSKWNFEGEENVFLASENLPGSFSLSRVNSDITVTMITREEIKKKEGRFKYYVFSPLVVRKGAVNVTLKKVNVYPQALSSDGVRYTCRKIRKNWRCSVSGFETVET